MPVLPVFLQFAMAEVRGDMGAAQGAQCVILGSATGRGVEDRSLDVFVESDHAMLGNLVAQCVTEVPIVGDSFVCGFQTGVGKCPVEACAFPIKKSIGGLDKDVAYRASVIFSTGGGKTMGRLSGGAATTAPSITVALATSGVCSSAAHVALLVHSSSAASPAASPLLPSRARVCAQGLGAWSAGGCCGPS